MKLVDIFSKRFTQVKRGSWLKNSELLVLIAFSGKMQAICWQLSGLGDQAHYLTDGHNNNKNDVTSPLTFDELKIILAAPTYDINEWEILSNEEAAKILARLPNQSV